MFVVEGDGRVDRSLEQQRMRFALLKFTECDANGSVLWPVRSVM
ncbi:hypothetical protein [Streptomyces sp. NPDC086777]